MPEYEQMCFYIYRKPCWQVPTWKLKIFQKKFFQTKLAVAHHRRPLSEPHHMLQLYVTPLPCNPMSQLYVVLLCYTYIALLLPHSIASPPPHITPRVKSDARAISGHKVNYSIECTWLCNKSRLFLKFFRHGLRHFLDPSWSRPSY